MGRPTNSISSANPFVPIGLPVRVLVVLATFIYWLTISYFSSVMATENIELLILGNAIMLASMIFPVLLPGSNGYFQPLVYISLYSTAKTLASKTGSFVTGLESHVALPELDSAQLMQLYFFVCCITALANFSTVIGYYLVPLRDSLPRFVTFHREGNVYLGVGAAVWIAIGYLAFLLLVANTGSLKQHLLNIARSRSQEVYSGDASFVGSLQVFTTFALAAACTLAAIQRKAGKTLLFVGGVMSAVCLEYLISGKRSDPIIALVIVGSIWIVRRQRFSYTFVVAILVIAVTVLAVGRSFRKANIKGSQSNIATDFMSGESPATLVNNAVSEMSARSSEGNAIYPIVHRVPGEISLLWGISYAEFAYRFIPRAIWRSKPRGIGRECAHVFFGEVKGIPPGAIGEAFWNFHLPGVVMVFLAWGVFLRFLADTFRENCKTPGMLAIYVVTLVLLRPDHNGYREWLHLFMPLAMLLVVGGLVSFGQKSHVNPAVR